MKQQISLYPKIIIENLSVFYYQRLVVNNISFTIYENQITTIVGPSGCGKSTLLMSINRIIDYIPQVRVNGKILVKINSENWIDIYGLKEEELPDLRRKICYVFQQPNVLPMSIFQNVAFPLKLKGLPKSEISERVEKVLKKVALWNEVKDRLQKAAVELSGGQQQRLCLARALVLEPEVLLLDEPTAFLDRSTAEHIENLLISLKSNCTIVMVTHYMDQVKRISDNVIDFSHF